MRSGKFLKCSIGIALVISFISPVFVNSNIAAIEIGRDINLTGTMRWRMELDDRDFNSSTAINELQYLRTRLELDITSIDKAQIFVQIQDSRNLGVNSSGLANDTNLGIHQAYMNLEDITFDNLDLQLGRFEVKYGRERLMGVVGWSNIGRSFDGIRASYRPNDDRYDFFILKVNERSFNIPPNHRDWNLYGFYGTVLDKHLDLFLLHDWDMRKVGDDYMMARFTTGFYYQRNLNSKLFLELDAAYQGGSQAGDDISAYMLAGDLSYKAGKSVDNIGIGFDITSGDDDPGDDKNKTFNNLYYTGHKFRGYMDYFVGSMAEGLLDIIFRASLKPGENFSLKIDLHHFQTMEDYPIGGGNESKQLGQEIDVTGKTSISKNLTFQTGISMFFASDDWRPDSDPSTWIYLMLNAGF